jgi:hypothetical protein
VSHSAGRIQAAFRKLQSIVPDVTGDYMHIPAVVIFRESFTYGHRDGVGFLARGTSCTPYPQWAQCLTIISPGDFGKNIMLQNFERAGRPEEASVAGQ